MIPVRVECGKSPAYLYACFIDCLARGEAPLSVVLYVAMLDELAEHNGSEVDAAHNRNAFDAANAWVETARRVVVFTDLGITGRMAQTIREARAKDIPVEFRSLPEFRTSDNPFDGLAEVP